MTKQLSTRKRFRFTADFLHYLSKAAVSNPLGVDAGVLRDSDCVLHDRAESQRCPSLPVRCGLVTQQPISHLLEAISIDELSCLQLTGNYKEEKQGPHLLRADSLELPRVIFSPAIKIVWLEQLQIDGVILCFVKII